MADKVFKMQKRTIRTIHGRPSNSHTEPLFKKSNILMLHDLYTYNVGIFMYKFKNYMLPGSFNDLQYFVCSDGPQTRQTSLANCRRYRTNFSSIQPVHSFPRIWTNFDIKLHDIRTLAMVKKACKTNFISGYAIRVKCSNLYCRDCYTN